MTDKLKALERQIEIFTIFYPTKKVQVFSISDLAEKYKVEEKTIIKDFKALQLIGLPIYQKDARGVRITGDADPNVLKVLLFKYISTYHTEVIVSNSFYNITYGSEMASVNNLRDILKAIESKALLKIRYKADIRNVIELTVLPYQIITNKSELEFIGIHNNTADTYKISKIVSIESTSKEDSNNYNQIVEGFHKRHTFPSAKIKLNITTAKKHWVEDYMLFEITTSKIVDGINSDEINHFSLRGVSDWYLHNSRILPNISPGYFREFSTFVIEQYWQIKVIDNETVRETIHQIDTNPFLERFKKSTTRMNDTRKDETFPGPITNSNPSKQTQIPKENIEYGVSKKEIPILQKPSLQSDDTNKNKSNADYCGPAIQIDRQLHTYESLEIELLIKDLYDYKEKESSLNFIKRILNKWFA